MPWTDWQFWFVSALAIGGLWVLVRALAPNRGSRGEDAGCPNCPSGSSKPRATKRVALTVERRRV